MFWRIEKYLVPLGIRISDRAARSLLSAPIELSRLQLVHRTNNGGWFTGNKGSLQTVTASLVLISS